MLPIKLFQYITCYSLSLTSLCHFWRSSSFQYITCYSLSRNEFSWQIWKFVSIHHMLLFIRFLLYNNKISESVSIHHMLLFILDAQFSMAVAELFQYITCYSLSGSTVDRMYSAGVSIHHMLLFIHFLQVLYLPCAVSIHHILLFIIVARPESTEDEEFQYITCYSLSDCWRRYIYRYIVSIHHMLLFIKMVGGYYLRQYVFQYITCYSLSTLPAFSLAGFTGFNTSHVTLYLDSW